MTFNPDKPPKGFPKDGLINLNRKPYITHVGLIWLANQAGKPWSSSIDNIDIKYDQNGMPVFALVVVTVNDENGSHCALGDASLQSVGRGITPHLVRMAHTRALNRALRAFVGYAGTTADEMEIDISVESDQPSPRVKSLPPVPPQGPVDVKSPTVNNQAANGLACPACGSEVRDQRLTREGKQPAFKCTNRNCKGGKNGYSWATWNEDYFDEGVSSLPQPKSMDKPAHDATMATRMLNDGINQDARVERLEDEVPF